MGLFGKKKYKPVELNSAEEELEFIKKILSLSLSQRLIRDRLELNYFEVVDQTDIDFVIKGSHGFLAFIINEDTEIKSCIYHHPNGETTPLVKSDVNDFGQLTFEKIKIEED